MAKNYTTQTASLRATTIDARVIDANRIKIKGQKIEDLWGLKLPEDYAKLVTRCELPKDKSWKIYNDCGKLVHYNIASQMTNLNGMFSYDSLITFETDLSSITTAKNMFYGCSNLTTFNSDLSSLTDGEWMFYDCSNLTTFNSDLSSLTNGSYMFSNTGIKEWNTDLSNVVNGEGMFSYCSNLTTFTSDLSSLTECRHLFAEVPCLTTINADFSSLTTGSNMFYLKNSVTTFVGDLSSLTNGDYMFSYCSKLENFTSDLSSLTSGNGMFQSCVLSAESVENILSSLPYVQDSNSLTLGVSDEGLVKAKEMIQNVDEYLYGTYKGWRIHMYQNVSSSVNCSCGSCC